MAQCTNFFATRNSMPAVSSTPPSATKPTTTMGSTSEDQSLRTSCSSSVTIFAYPIIKPTPTASASPPWTCAPATFRAPLPSFTIRPQATPTALGASLSKATLFHPAASTPSPPRFWDWFLLRTFRATPTITSPCPVPAGMARWSPLTGNASAATTPPGPVSAILGFLSAANPGSNRCAKALVQVGEPAALATDSACRHVYGLPLELVPEQNPYRLAADKALTVRVLRAGRPAAGTAVQIWQRQPGGLPTSHFTTRANQNGRILLRLSGPGPYLLAAVSMAEAPAKLRDRADWQSTWASLTFAGPPAAARPTTKH